MKISDRLRCIYECVEPGETVADIGTDHGYVPLTLYAGGVSPDVIMSDISIGSLAKARAAFAEKGISIPDDRFRVGDGLETLSPGEVDTVVIAGLGGRTITDILENDPDKSASYSKYILQPRNAAGLLRHWLYSHGYDITGERLSREGKFICEVIVTKRSDELFSHVNAGASLSREPFYRDTPYPADDVRWMYPESFKDCDRSLLEDRLRWKFNSIADEIASLRLSVADKSDRIARLEADREYLRGLICNS